MDGIQEWKDRFLAERAGKTDKECSVILIEQFERAVDGLESKDLPNLPYITDYTWKRINNALIETGKKREKAIQVLIEESSIKRGILGVIAAASTKLHQQKTAELRERRRMNRSTFGKIK